MITTSASIVFYKHNYNDVLDLIKLIHNSEVDCLFIIDNSPNDLLSSLCNSFSKIKYFHFPANLGFGKGHNVALNRAMEKSYDFHIIINPDIKFFVGTIEIMIDYMKNDGTIGMMMPQVLNNDGSLQFLPKLIPAPWDVILRILKWPKKYYNKFINKYELRKNKEIINVPILSGCFTVLNIDAIKKVGLYDDRFFMYFEDWDLSRRMNQNFKTIYFPRASVFHGYEGGAKKKLKLFKIFFFSYIRYFNKWGWFIDENRKKVNENILMQFQIK
jgi:GT2 family glycosyltransferase